MELPWRPLALPPLADAEEGNNLSNFPFSLPPFGPCRGNPNGQTASRAAASTFALRLALSIKIAKFEKARPQPASRNEQR